MKYSKKVKSHSMTTPFICAANYDIFIPAQTRLSPSIKHFAFINSFDVLFTEIKDISKAFCNTPN